MFYIVIYSFQVLHLLQVFTVYPVDSLLLWVSFVSVINKKKTRWHDPFGKFDHSDHDDPYNIVNSLEATELIVTTRTMMIPNGTQT